VYEKYVNIADMKVQYFVDGLDDVACSKTLNLTAATERRKHGNRKE